jgi:RNA polymerase sigma-32 factor
MAKAKTRKKAAAPLKPRRKKPTPKTETPARPEPEEQAKRLEPVEPAASAAPLIEGGAASVGPVESLAEDLHPKVEAKRMLQGMSHPDAPPPRHTAALAIRDSARDLVTSDPLQLYMAEVKRHPLLSREDEQKLAIRYRTSGDLEAAYRLVAANLRLVVKIAHDYHRNPLSLLDLIQEGNIGLMQAVKKYDPSRGVKLSSYAAWWIRAYILRYIMDNWRMVKLGTTEAQRKLFFKLRQEQERLISQGFEPSPKLLAERLKVTEQDVVEMDQRLGPEEVALDAPIGEGGRESRVDRVLPAEAIPADVRLGNEELKRIFGEKLAEFAKDLKGKERFIYERRLIAEEPLTLQEIGDHYGVSRERARQIEAGLIGRIRQYLHQQIPDFDLVAAEKS